MIDRYTLKDIIGDPARIARFDRYMAPEGLVLGGAVVPYWTDDGSSFWYAQGQPECIRILQVDARSGEIAPLPDTPVSTRENGRLRFYRDGKDFEISARDRAITGVDASTSGSNARPYRRPMWLMEPMLVNETASPDKRWFAGISDGNIVLRSGADNRLMALTNDGNADFAWDVEGKRHKLRAGLVLFEHVLDPWSPDSTHLFALKIDRRAVPTVPLVRNLKREEEVTPFRVQRAGGAIDIAHPHVIDILSKRVRSLDVGDTEDHYFTLVGWRPDGSEVLFTRHARDFKRVDLLAGNPVTGAVRTLLTEEAETFVGLQHDVIFGGDNHIFMLDDSLAWRSARSGWNHFYRYALDGTLLGPLTQGEFPVIDILAVNESEGWLYFTAHHDQDRPYDQHLCRVPLGGGATERLTPLDGQNTVSMSPSMQYFTVVNSRPDRPFRTDLHACDGRHIAVVEQADVSALDALGHIASEEFTVLAADGETILWGVMHKPADFDPARKYPVLDHLYGGPQIAFVSHQFGLGDYSQERLDRALAQLGYIVISLDARGTPERSKAFHDVVYRNWGRHEIADHASAIRQLAERHSFMDIDRVGLFGHSWGGYFATRALAQAPDLFRAAVASAPTFDPYDDILYEPYLDLPTRAKSAYDYASNYPLAEKIMGRLMLAIGTADPKNLSDVMQMVHHLIAAGIDHELVVLPEVGHGFEGPSDDYYIRKLVRHFETHLKQLRPAGGADREDAPGSQVGPRRTA